MPITNIRPHAKHYWVRSKKGYLFCAIGGCPARKD